MGEIQRRSKRTYLFLTLVTAASAVLIYTVTLAFMVRPSHDQSWYLYAAQQMLSGVKLYGPHLSETNPPAILWFSTIPVLLARIVSVSPTLMLRLIVTVMAYGSAAWSVRILRIQNGRERSFELALIGIAIAGCALGIEAPDFAQREQLMVILTLPYIVAAASLSARRLSVAEYCGIGVLAGLGVCLKPQQVLAIAALEICLLLYSRNVRRILRPELLALLGVGVLYLLLIRFVAPLYLRDTVPQLLQTYWAFGKSSAFDLAVHDQRHFIISLALVLGGCFVLRRSLRYPLVSFSFAVCSIGASIALDIQHAGWTYQAFPKKTFLFLAFVLLALDVVYPMLEMWARSSNPVSALAVIAIALLMAWQGGLTIHERSLRRLPPEQVYLAPLLAPYAPQTTVYVFSTALPAFSEVYSHHLLWGSRFGHLWRLPAIVLNQPGISYHEKTFKRLTPGVLTDLEALQRRETAEDLGYWRPPVVMVERCTDRHYCGFLEGHPFDFLTWFLQSPAFAAEWTHYRQQPGNDVFDVYTRVP
ncbi:MAG: hypothetical protein JWM43_1510 [Acidobacteriaceae bacterium]|nr:hypothetical protein [Acidobacteriaceae bacterium]